jgi:hypothetical protein
MKEQILTLPYRWISLVLLLATLFSTPAPYGLAQGATVVVVDPPSLEMGVGATTAVDIRIENVTGLFGSDVRLTFNPVLLEVVDADPGTVGVQIQPGTFPSPDFVAQNNVDQSAGTINFAIAQTPPHEPVSGSGVLATVTFRGKAAGTSALGFTGVFLSTRDGVPISADARGGSITVLSSLTLTGWLTREGLGGDDRSVVNAVLYPAVTPYEPISWGRACTDATGDFTLQIMDDQHSPPADILPSDNPPASPTCTSRWAFMRLDFTNYLSECYWECADSDSRDIGWHDLEGGDVNGDGCINIYDVVHIIGGFGETVEAPCYIPCEECPPDASSSNVAPPCDVNGDCRVNILDLTQAAGNFGLCSNCP